MKAQEGSQKAPEAPQNLTKQIQKWIRRLHIFGPILERVWGPNRLTKGTNDGISFETRLPRIAGPRVSPKQKTNEDGEKCQAVGIMPRKREGGFKLF